MPRVKAMKTKRILLSILFPERCACCGRVIPPSAGCCPSCLEKLPVIEPPLCPFCGAGTEDCTCGRHRRHFDRCASPFYYEDPVKEGILLFKEYGSAESAAFFAERMAEVFLREWGSPYLDGIVPVPMRKEEIRKRGHNQSRLLAKALSGYLNAPVIDVLVKIAAIRPQKELTALERGGNVLGAYDVREDALQNRALEGARLLLVDDVITTGATLDECAKVLKIAGAAEVLALTAARARLRSSNK